MIVAAPEKPGAFLNSDNPLMSPRHRVANRAGTGAGFLKTSSTLSVRRYARSTDWNASTGHVTRHVLHRCFNMPHISLRTQAAGATAVKANGYAWTGKTGKTCWWGEASHDGHEFFPTYCRFKHWRGYNQRSSYSSWAGHQRLRGKDHVEHQRPQEEDWLVLTSTGTYQADSCPVHTTRVPITRG